MAKNNEDRIRFANDEIIGKGNLAVVDELFSTGYIAHAGSKSHKGHAFIRRYVKLLRTSIPDVKVVEVTILSQAKATIVWQRTLRGTHKVEMKAIPPSGKKVQWTEMFVSRFEGGKIAEDWMVSDLAGQLLLKLHRP